MIFFKLPLPISVNKMYVPTKQRGFWLRDSAKQYKREVSFVALKHKGEFKEKEELIYFTLWGLKDKRNDSHNYEKLLWDALEYACVYPNDRMLRHCAGSTYIMDEEKKGFVVVGLAKYSSWEDVPSFHECYYQARTLLSS